MITEWNKLDPTQVLALRGYGGEPGIYVRASMVRALKGDGTAAILLSQLLFWSQSKKAEESDGWFYMTTPAVTKTLGITRHIQLRVRKLLEEMGILEISKGGMPAKNYYRVHLDRVLELLTAAQYQEGAATSEPESGPPVAAYAATSEPESGRLVAKKADDIVNTLVNTRTPYSKPTLSPGRKNEDALNVLGKEFDRAVEIVIGMYPVDGQGLQVTPYKAGRILRKLGRIGKNASQEERAQAWERLREFKQALVNIQAAVANGEVKNQFVPKFDNFAGLGVTYGKEAGYIAWAKRSSTRPAPVPRRTDPWTA